jgi:Protein of unknown function (DUF3810)
LKKALYFLLACLVLRVLFSSFPSLTERCYSRTLFVAYRWVWDSSFGQSPVALVYVFLVLPFVWWLGRMVYFFIKKQKNTGTNIVENVVEKTPAQWLFGFLSGIFSVIVYIIGSFLLFWGYNYCRIPFETQINIKIEDSLDLAVLRTEAKLITVECAAIRDSLTAQKGVIKIKNKARNAKKAVQIDFDFDSLETETRANLEAVLSDLNFPTGGAVRGRLLYPAGILLRNNTAGVYLPWTGEGHLDSGLHPLQIPFTLAHEMSHGYGFTDEGVCNFLAYLACERSQNPFIKYSGRLSHWRYVFSALHKKNTPAYLWERAKIPRGMHEDIKSVRKKMDEYPDLLKGVQASTYDSYLKIQGVKEGMDSYDRMVALVIAWRKR